MEYLTKEKAELIARGKQQGYLYREEIESELIPFAISAEELDEFLSELKNVHGIEVRVEDDESENAGYISTGDTSANDEIIAIYLRDIGHFAELSREEEVELAKRIAEGDEDAFVKMVNHNLKLVVYIAKKFARNNVGSSLSLMDLIQEGNLGLIHAVRKYDYRLGYKFSTYATCWIKQAIMRIISEKSGQIRFPAYFKEHLKRLAKIENDYYVQTGEHPTVEQIAEAMGESVAFVEMLKTYSSDVKSLDIEIDDDNDTSLVAMIADENQAPPSAMSDDMALKKLLNLAMSLLNPREAVVLTYKYGLRDGRVKTLEETGAHFKVTRERVRQIQLSAFKRLKKSPLASQLKDFLDTI